jgi:hypothetical protein
MAVNIPNGDFIRSTHTVTFDIPALDIAVREAHIFPNHFQHSIFRLDNFVTMAVRSLFYPKA